MADDPYNLDLADPNTIDTFQDWVGTIDIPARYNPLTLKTYAKKKKSPEKASFLERMKSMCTVRYKFSPAWVKEKTNKVVSTTETQASKKRRISSKDSGFNDSASQIIEEYDSSDTDSRPKISRRMRLFGTEEKKSPPSCKRKKPFFAKATPGPKSKKPTAAASSSKLTVKFKAHSPVIKNLKFKKSSPGYRGLIEDLTTSSQEIEVDSSPELPKRQSRTSGGGKAKRQTTTGSRRSARLSKPMTATSEPFINAKTTIEKDIASPATKDPKSNKTADKIGDQPKPNEVKEPNEKEPAGSSSQSDQESQMTASMVSSNLTLDDHLERKIDSLYCQEQLMAGDAASPVHSGINPSSSSSEPETQSNEKGGIDQLTVVPASDSEDELMPRVQDGCQEEDHNTLHHPPNLQIVRDEAETNGTLRTPIKEYPGEKTPMNSPSLVARVLDNSINRAHTRETKQTQVMSGFSRWDRCIPRNFEDDDSLCGSIDNDYNLWEDPDIMGVQEKENEDDESKTVEDDPKADAEEIDVRSNGKENWNSPAGNTGCEPTKDANQLSKEHVDIAGLILKPLEEEVDNTPDEKVSQEELEGDGLDPLCCSGVEDCSDIFGFSSDNDDDEKDDVKGDTIKKALDAPAGDDFIGDMF